MKRRRAAAAERHESAAVRSVRAIPTGDRPADLVASPDSVVKHTGGGAFDSQEAPISFVVCSNSNMVEALPSATHVLVALNELNGPNDLARLDALLDSGRHKVLLDSGIHAINTAFVRAHPDHVGSSFLVPPKKMPGFAELRDKYVAVVKKYEDRLWGYVELDQGGIEWKPRIRAELEAEGLSPIPVYHPLVDPPGYFDELARSYDRVCLGNLAFQTAFVRKRLLLTIFERKRAYPHLWLHALGLFPNQWVRSMPIESCDSSTWTEPLRWGVFYEHANGQAISHLPKNFMYRYGAETDSPDSIQAAQTVAMTKAHMAQRNWRAGIADRAA